MAQSSSLASQAVESPVSWIPTGPFLLPTLLYRSIRTIMPGGSLLGLTYSREGDPRGHQVHEGCQAPLFHYWKDKKCHFPYVGCWEPNFRNVCFLESFPPMDFTNQLKKTHNREDKPALQNNEIPAKANRKITFLITWCFRLSMRVHTLFPRSYVTHSGPQLTASGSQRYISCYASSHWPADQTPSLGNDRVSSETGPDGPWEKP